jgi:hypothetical protein
MGLTVAAFAATASATGAGDRCYRFSAGRQS